MESLPWDMDGNSVDEVLFNHSLQRVGQDSAIFMGMMKELYRVCRPGARIQINVPHPRHDDFTNDPANVRSITPDTLAHFSKKQNQRWKEDGITKSLLGIYLDVDFEIERLEQVLEKQYEDMLQNKQITEAELAVLSRERMNVVREYRITLRVVK
jgi:predicted SAM-dependent methyltransferase